MPIYKEIVIKFQDIELRIYSRYPLENIKYNKYLKYPTITQYNGVGVNNLVLG